MFQHIVFGLADAGKDFDELHGSRLLESPGAAAIVRSALRYFNGERYRLIAWCVMPNHVHVVIAQVEGWPVAKIVHSWKSFTANHINQMLARTGAVWAREYYDRYMRDEEQLGATVRYVENNPVAARLVDRPEQWVWSSAYSEE